METDCESKHKRFPDEHGQHATKEKIDGFKHLEDGWHFGDGIVFDDAVLRRGKDLIDEAIDKGFLEVDAFPGIAGDVITTIHHGNYYLEFSIRPDGNVDFVKEENREEVCESEDISFGEALKEIVKFREEELWKSYDSSTGHFGRNQMEGFRVERLLLAATEAGFLSLPANV